MTTVEEIQEMTISKVQSTLRSLWMERRPNMELINACDNRIDELNKEIQKRKDAMMTHGDIDDFNGGM